MGRHSEIQSARKDLLAVSHEVAGRVLRFWLVRQSANYEIVG